jgi:hypothetical protein
VRGHEYKVIREELHRLRRWLGDQSGRAARLPKARFVDENSLIERRKAGSPFSLPLLLFLYYYSFATASGAVDGDEGDSSR